MLLPIGAPGFVPPCIRHRRLPFTAEDRHSPPERVSAVFVYGIAQRICQTDPAEKLGKVLKPLRKGRQPAITDLIPLRRMINGAEEDYARPITRLTLVTS